MTEQELNFYKKQEEEAKNKLWKIACEYGAEAHGRKPFIYWEDVEKIVKENKHLFLEEEDDDGSEFNLSFFLLQHLEGKVWIENYGKEQTKNIVSKIELKEKMLKYGFTAPDMTVTEFVEDFECL